MYFTVTNEIECTIARYNVNDTVRHVSSVTW